MNRQPTRSLVPRLLAVAALAMVTGFVTSCRSDDVGDHGDHGPPSVIACSKCYEQVVVQRSRIGGRNPRGRGSQVVFKHHCADCNAEMTITDEDGVATMRCPTCAPEGVACDRCVGPR